MALRVGPRSIDILLTDAGKRWFLDAYKKGIIDEYHEDEPFELMSMGTGFVEAICPQGIPYIFPISFDDKITFQMADQEETPVKGRGRRC